MFRYLSLALFGLVSICVLAVVVAALWVVYGVPHEPQRSDAPRPGLEFEARKAAAIGGAGPLRAGEVSTPGVQSRSAAAPMSPSITASGFAPRAGCEGGACASAGSFGSSQSSAEAAERNTATATPGDMRPLQRCNVELCAGTYKSFNNADCTYQPNNGGPRRLCELRTRSADRSLPTSRPSTELGSEVKDARVADVPQAATHAGAGARCNADACAARYASFHAADCTYQPRGGGPRRLCELSTRSAPAAGIEAEDTQIAESVDDTPNSTAPQRAGGQCNIEACADAYASFRAADCTYQPHGGGPRRVCER